MERAYLLTAEQRSSVPWRLANYSHPENRGHATPCWVWDRYKNPNGYGQMGVDRKVYLAHRVSYEHHVGPIPEGLTLDHLCRQRDCINPAHLEPVTQCVNNQRGYGSPGINGRKTHCLRGHEFTPENTYAPPKRPGQRYCRACMTERRRIRRLGNIPEG